MHVVWSSRAATSFTLNQISSLSQQINRIFSSFDKDLDRQRARTGIAPRIYTLVSGWLVSLSLEVTVGQIQLFDSNIVAMFTFQPNCSIPASGASYVASCNVRGTLDILWSCLFTIFLSTWSAQHLNVPRQRVEQTNRPLRQEIAAFAGSIWIKVKWMVTALILPELLVGRALQDWMMARRSSRDERFKYFASRDHTSWTIVHAFFANMGGFVVAVNPNGLSESKDLRILSQAILCMCADHFPLSLS